MAFIEPWTHGENFYYYNLNDTLSEKELKGLTRNIAELIFQVSEIRTHNLPALTYHGHFVSNAKTGISSHLEYIKSAIEHYPEVATIKLGKQLENIGMIAARNNFEEVVLLTLDIPEARIQQDKEGNNIGLLAAKNRMMKAVEKASTFKEVCEQKNKYGNSLDLEISNIKAKEKSKQAFYDALYYDGREY